MRTALVLMTILGCDDSATDCQHIATLQQRWTSIELCDAESEKQLGNFANASYPVIVAVCQTPETPKNETAKADAQTPDVSGVAPALAPQEEQTLTQRAIGRVRKILPSTEGVKEVLGKPVRMVEDSYSWIARRFTK
ncbi:MULTISPECIES: hypothetical protein [Agrobacterium]|uniref:Uncharacterized protein n=1 Tax=Agrobacterium rosae TaxID=1972867 RepID=A0A1R3TDI6_9HYPH|nr:MULTISPECIES: hypothetical protein [Agrobacterium]KAA3512190.1 hypothetical protein DXM21_11635 [Agrobacterium rosae]KAA3520360.1 hypothetical protein DXM25_11985 [Agrobacterium rosae]MBN7808047.1 hypothetical protein [Agrobacterium rosae]MCM2432245.1 hypothetical protein [Agrobacterium rosae]MDX8301147.1 hypothetical protein [Agrobacterium rosae]